MGYMQLLREKVDFRNLLIGQFVSETGNWFNFIAGLGLVRVFSDSSPMAAAMLFVARLIPFAVLSPFAGTFVDRFSRRQVMIWTDLLRVAVALMFVFVNSAEDLWIAYLATVLLSGSGAFFDGAKNAATPNMTGKEGLLAGTALMFSTRFLLMAVGSALGGIAAMIFGYKIAFIINAASFAVSAYTVWLIPEESTRDQETADKMSGERDSFMTELKEGLKYTVNNRFAFTVLIVNIVWAAGGGSINMVFERLGGVHFAKTQQLDPDFAVAMLWLANGMGLFIGMLLAHRVDGLLAIGSNRGKFICFALIVHGILFAIGGYMPSVFLFGIFIVISRVLIGVEYAVQETMFQKSLPDYIRGRISTLDRGTEITVFGMSSYFAGLAMSVITPQTLTLISGLLSALSGVLWFFREGLREPGKEKQ